MPFLQKKPQISSSIPLYTLGLNKTILIVGLGNIGDEYQNSRHNVGFACIEAFAETTNFPAWVKKQDLKCYLTSQNLGDTRVIIIKPTTFMNLSGEAVQETAHFYKIAPEDTIVVYDELDIPFGQIRTKQGGSAAGHNGVSSIIQRFGAEFYRVRIGIGPKKPQHSDSADFVIAKFTKSEISKLPALKREVSAILSESLYGNQPLANDTRSFII